MSKLARSIADGVKKLAEARKPKSAAKPKDKKTAKPKAEKPVAAPHVPKAEQVQKNGLFLKNWYVGIETEDPAKTKLVGPFAKKRQALMTVGSKVGDYTSKIDKGCYRRGDKQPDGSKITYIVMTDWYGKKHGYEIPETKAKTSVVAETPAACRVRRSHK